MKEMIREKVTVDTGITACVGKMSENKWHCGVIHRQHALF